MATPADTPDAPDTAGQAGEPVEEHSLDRFRRFEDALARRELDREVGRDDRTRRIGARAAVGSVGLVVVILVAGYVAG